jgi:hypothetical protein
MSAKPQNQNAAPAGEPKQPADKPQPEPKRPGQPRPVDEPPDPDGRGAGPDYFPGKPAGGDLPKF